MRISAVMATMMALWLHASSSAIAQTALCDLAKGQRIFVDKLIGKDETLQIIRQSQNLSDAVAQAQADCTSNPANPSCAGGVKKSLLDLYAKADYWANLTIPDESDGLRIRRDAPPSSDEAKVARTTELLNDRPVPWFRVCSIDAPSSGGASGDQARKSWAAEFLKGLIVGKSKADASRGFAKREFATIEYADDRNADSKSYGVDLFVGWKGPVQQTGEAIYSVAPFVSLQKKTIDADTSSGEIDDLTFGLAVPVTTVGASLWQQHVISPAIEWETDTEFDSSMTIASLAWTPVGLGSWCWGHFVSPDFRLRCDYALVVDYANVGDPGQKASLLSVNEYSRVGVNLGLDYFHDLPGGSELNLGVSFKSRHAFDGDEGDADVFDAALRFLPAENSHFSFGIEYRHGEDLSSLETEETTTIRLGYRY